jgi:hypothetical protein
MTEVQERIRAREEGLKCADVAVALVVVADVLTEEVVVEVSGCLFVVTVMSSTTSMIRVGMEDVEMHVVADVARSIPSALLVRSPSRRPKHRHPHLHLHLHQLLP